MIEFRKLTYDCIPMLIEWLERSHVKEYWDKDIIYTKKMLFEKYSKRIEDQTVNMYIIVLNSKDMGYIQSYEPELRELMNYRIASNCSGIDLYISEESLIGKGLGTRIIKLFVGDYIFSDDYYNFVCIDPESRNIRAIKAYEKVGFKHTITRTDSESGLLTYYMLLNKKQFLENNK